MRARRRPAGVRARITILATLTAAIALAFAGTALLQALNSSLVAGTDHAARARLDDLSALAATATIPATLPAPDEDDFAMVTAASGAVIAASANIAGHPPALTFSAGAAPAGRTVHELLVNGDNADYRLWTAAVPVAGPAAAGPVTIVVGTSLEPVETAVDAVQQALAVGLPPLLALLAFGTWLVVGRALRPVEAIRAEVADISSHALHRRVPESPSTDEISRLARTMNQMLDRLEHAAERQRRFAADAAHELQTPLAAFRTHLEVALTHPDAADWPVTVADLLQQSQQMERLVRDLLFLSRGENAPPPAMTMVDLDDIVLTEAARIRATARVRVDTSRVSATPVTGRRDELTRLTRNLLENAQRHASTLITVELHTADGQAHLTVADDGPGIPPEDRERVFHRFARLDDARDRDSGGTGLGLAIVRDIADRHGATVSLDPSVHGARFVVRLPAPG